MKDESTAALPGVVERATFQAELDRRGRPIAQWSRLEAGRSDELTAGSDK
jgi:hypothetical protein